MKIEMRTVLQDFSLPTATMKQIADLLFHAAKQP